MRGRGSEHRAGQKLRLRGTIAGNLPWRKATGPTPEKTVTFSVAKKEEQSLGGGNRRTVWSWHVLWKRGPMMAVVQEELRIFLK